MKTLVKSAPIVPPANMHGTSTLFVRDLNPDDHANFKAACARRGRTMRGIILAFMKDVRSGNDSKKIIDLGALSRAYPQSKDNPK